MESGFNLFLWNRKHRLQPAVHILTPHFLAAPAVETLRPSIPELVRTSQVANHDGFGSQFEQLGAGSELFFAVAQFFGTFCYASIKFIVQPFELSGLPLGI